MLTFFLGSFYWPSSNSHKNLDSINNNKKVLIIIDISFSQWIKNKDSHSSSLIIERGIEAQQGDSYNKAIFISILWIYCLILHPTECEDLYFPVAFLPRLVYR